MAVVTIKIEDVEGGGCVVYCESDPPVSEDDSKATHSQLAAAVMMKMLDAIVKEAMAEGDSE